MATSVTSIKQENAVSPCSVIQKPPLKIGERVVWFGNDQPEHGTVKWIGILLDICHDWTAGVELDNPVGGIDGFWGGSKLFDCKPKHGMVIAIHGLIKEEDFSGSGSADDPMPLQDFDEILDAPSVGLTNGHQTDSDGDGASKDQKRENDPSPSEGDKYIEKFLAAQSTPRTGAASSFDRRVYARMFAECEVEKWYEVLNYPHDCPSSSLDIGFERERKKKKDTFFNRSKDSSMCRNGEYAETKKKERGGIFRFFRWLRRSRSSKTALDIDGTRNATSGLGQSGKTKSLESVTSLSESFHYIPVGDLCSEEEPDGANLRDCVYEDLEPGSSRLTPQGLAKMKCSSLSRVVGDERERRRRFALEDDLRPRSVRSACSPNSINSSLGRKKRRAPLPPMMKAPVGLRSAANPRNHWVRVLPTTSDASAKGLAGSTSRLTNGDIVLSQLGDSDRKMAASTGAIHRASAAIEQKPADPRREEATKASGHQRSASLIAAEDVVKASPNARRIGSHSKNKRRAPQPPSPRQGETGVKSQEKIVVKPIGQPLVKDVFGKLDETDAEVPVADGNSTGNIDGTAHGEVILVKVEAKVAAQEEVSVPISAADVEGREGISAQETVEENLKGAGNEQDVPPELPKKTKCGKMQPRVQAMCKSSAFEVAQFAAGDKIKLGNGEDDSQNYTNKTDEASSNSLRVKQLDSKNDKGPTPDVSGEIESTMEAEKVEKVKKPERKFAKVSGSADSSPIVIKVKELRMKENEEKGRSKAEAQLNIQALQELVESLVDQYCGSGKADEQIKAKIKASQKQKSTDEDCQAKSGNVVSEQSFSVGLSGSIATQNCESGEERAENLTADEQGIELHTDEEDVNSSSTTASSISEVRELEAGNGEKGGIEDNADADELASKLLKRWQDRMQGQVDKSDSNHYENVSKMNGKDPLPQISQQMTLKGKREDENGIYEPIGDFLHGRNEKYGSANNGVHNPEYVTSFERNSGSASKERCSSNGRGGARRSSASSYSGVGYDGFKGDSDQGFVEDVEEEEFKDPFMFWRDLCAKKYTEQVPSQNGTTEKSEKVIRRLSVNGQRQLMKKEAPETGTNGTSGSRGPKEGKPVRAGGEARFRSYENVFAATPHRMVVVDGITVPHQYENCNSGAPVAGPYWAPPHVLPYYAAMQRRYVAPFQALTVMPFVAPPVPQMYPDPRFHPGGYLNPSSYRDYVYPDLAPAVKAAPPPGKSGSTPAQCGKGRQAGKFGKDLMSGCSHLQELPSRHDGSSVVCPNPDAESEEESSDSGKKRYARPQKARGKSRSLDRNAYANVPPSPPPRVSSSGRPSRLAASCDWLKESGKSVQAKIKAARGENEVKSDPKMRDPTEPKKMQKGDVDAPREAKPAPAIHADIGTGLMDMFVVIGGIKVPTPFGLWPLEYEIIAPELNRLEARMEGKRIEEDGATDDGDVDSLAVNRLLRQLEIAISSGKKDEAAALARDLAQLKIQCSVLYNRRPSGDGDGQAVPIIVNMFVEDKVSHHGPIPIRLLPNINVVELKEKIFREFQFPVAVQRWILGKKLADNDKLPISNYGVDTNGCPVFLYLMSAEDLQIKSKNLVWDDNISPNASAAKIKNNRPIKAARTKKVPVKNHKRNTELKEIEEVKTAVEDGEEVYSTRTLGWSCDKCTLVNIPTRPGCAMCGSARPDDYVVPLQYKMRESELERLAVEKEQEMAMKEAEEQQRLENWNRYLRLEDMDLIHNDDTFECSICFAETPPGEGVKLRDCLHLFCCDCLRNAITHCEAATVICPFRDDDYSCDSVLQEREIRALVPAEAFERYLQRSMATAESQAPNSFHCKTPDCQGWCLIEDNANEFYCPVCVHLNCITCRAIHETLNCRQYQDKIMMLARTDEEAKKTKDVIEEMLQRGEAMNCPNCKVIIMKKWGCDWLCCSVCKTEICWVTKGPRWGPNGRGDLSAGCKCGTNGVRCHPKCNYCH